MSARHPGSIRVVSGLHRNRKLVVPPGIRPTSSRVREALFDVLAHNPWSPSGDPLPQGARVVDAFAGSGALGIEALSRGAEEVVFLELDSDARAALRRNVGALDEASRATVLPRSAAAPGVRPIELPVGLVIADAPYGSGLAALSLAALAEAGWLAPRAVAAVELDAREEFAPPEGFAAVDDRRYGRTRMLFLQRL